MPDEHDNDARKKLEQEVWSAISAFEQILEAMPQDIASLQALSHAYEQIGDLTRAKDYLLRLGGVLLDEGDVAAAKELVHKIAAYAGEDARAADLVARIEQAGLKPPPAVVPTAEPVAGSRALRQEVQERAVFSMADELSFAWNLMEAKELTQDEYASIVHDLTEMSATDNNTTISVLHVLQFRASKSLDRIMGFVARDCGTPIVALGSFGFPVDAMLALDLTFMIRRGALVFGFIGSEALVVVMNPYNELLRKDIEVITGRKCHFFVALPSDFDQAMLRVRSQLGEKTAAESSA
jgi:hypothetical protein